MRVPIHHHHYYRHHLADDSEHPVIVHSKEHVESRRAQRGSESIERENTPTMESDKGSLGRYVKAQGRGVTIRKGKPVIEEMPKRDPDSRLLSRDPLP